MHDPDIEDWFKALADEIGRRWVIEAEPPKHFSPSGVILLIQGALQALGKKMRESAVVEDLADGTVVAQRPRAILTIRPTPSEPFEIVLPPGEPAPIPELPGPINKHASLGTLKGHLAEILDECRLPPEVIERSEPWRLERLLDELSDARSAIDAVAGYVRAQLAKRDPGISSK